MQHLCSSPWRVCSELMADGAVDAFIQNIYYSKITAFFTALYAPALNLLVEHLFYCSVWIYSLLFLKARSIISLLSSLFFFTTTHISSPQILCKNSFCLEQRSSSESGFGILRHNRKTMIKSTKY